MDYQEMYVEKLKSEIIQIDLESKSLEKQLRELDEPMQNVIQKIKLARELQAELRTSLNLVPQYSAEYNKLNKRKTQILNQSVMLSMKKQELLKKIDKIQNKNGKSDNDENA